MKCNVCGKRMKDGDIYLETTYSCNFCMRCFSITNHNLTHDYVWKMFGKIPEEIDNFNPSRRTQDE